MSRSIEAIKRDILKHKFNPAGMARVGVDIIEEASNGEFQFVDVTNPVVALLSSCATMVASFIEEDHTLTRKQYPYSAQTKEDLYPHMSDKDYFDIHAKPSYADFLFVFDANELSQKMEYIKNTSTQLLVIPRNTKIFLGEIAFSFQYPVEIKRFANGGFRVNYDITKRGELTTINNNVIDSTIITPESGQKYLTFNALLHQFDIVTKTMHINTASINSITVEHPDQFCHAAVWMKDGFGNWKKISTTHTDQIYDVSKPTACLTVLDGAVRVKIPQIYISKGIVNGTVRIDIYHTKGDINMNLVNYTNENYTVEWLAIDKTEQTIFVAPLERIRNTQIYSRDIVRGGTEQMSFEQLYERVISNSIGDPQVPITDRQIESAYERDGFKLSRVVDTISNRVYIGVRTMPAPVNSDLITAVAAGVETFNDAIENIANIETVVYNGEYTTILPSTLYKRGSGQIKVVSQSELDSIKLIESEEIPQWLEKNKYVFSPFHYVLYTGNNDFVCNTYWMGDPYINYRNFIDENTTTLLSVSTAILTLELSNYGYTLYVKTKSNDKYKMVYNDRVFAQLSFTANDNVRYGVNAVLHSVANDGERVFRFELKTSNLIDLNDRLELIELYDENGNTDAKAFIGLKQGFDITFGTTQQMPVGWVRSEIDSLAMDSIYGTSATAISQEYYSLTFGERLKHMWSRARTVVTEESYERYTADVYERHTSDGFLINKNTNSAISFNQDGTIKYTNTYKAGELVLDANGDPKIKFRAGDIKLDAMGKKVLVAPRKLRRQFDIIVLDGVYKFANTKIVSNYITDMCRQVARWVNDDIPRLDKTLLELTNLYFYPMKTIGLVDVMYDNGQISTIEASQKFDVTLFVKPTLYENTELRESVRRSVIQVIDSCLISRTVAVSDLVKKIKEANQDNVTAVDINGFGTNNNLQIVSMVDSSNSLSISKRLAYRNDGSLVVEEDIAINFILHDSYFADQ